jgi:hypothetical protein
LVILAVGPRVGVVPPTTAVNRVLAATHVVAHIDTGRPGDAGLVRRENSDILCNHHTADHNRISGNTKIYCWITNSSSGRPRNSYKIVDVSPGHTDGKASDVIYLITKSDLDICRASSIGSGLIPKLDIVITAAKTSIILTGLGQSRTIVCYIGYVAIPLSAIVGTNDNN